VVIVRWRYSPAAATMPCTAANTLVRPSEYATEPSSNGSRSDSEKAEVKTPPKRLIMIDRSATGINRPHHSFVEATLRSSARTAAPTAPGLIPPATAPP
jgi:hypothetical protein